MQHIYNTFTVPCEKSKTVSCASSKIKNIVSSAWSKFAVNGFAELLKEQHQLFVAWLNLLHYFVNIFEVRIV